jgi:GrpB protein
MLARARTFRNPLFRAPGALERASVNRVSDSTPPWAYEQPTVHPHDPRLIEQAEIERARLAELLRYGDLKRGLADEHPDDREAYTEAKAEFIAEALARETPEPPGGNA